MNFFIKGLDLTINIPKRYRIHRIYNKYYGFPMLSLYTHDLITLSEENDYAI